jgi:hypothetical protein
MKKLLTAIFLIFSITATAQVMLPGVVASSVATSGSSLLTDILAYWKYDEDSGTNLNDEVSTHDGTAQTGSTTGIDAKIDDGVEITTSTGDIYVPNFNISGDQLSISCWFKLDVLPSTAATDYVILNANHSVSPYFAFEIIIKQTTDYIAFKVTNTTPTTYNAQTANSVITTGTWYHLVCVLQGAGLTMQIHLNNSNVTNTSDAWSGTIFQNNAGWSIGNSWYDGDGTLGVDGILDEIGIWDKKLSTAEISELWNGGAGNSHPFN